MLKCLCQQATGRSKLSDQIETRNTTSVAQHQSANDSSGLGPKRRRFKKRWLLYGLLIVGLGPYLFFRATSFMRKIQLVELNNAAGVTELDSPLRVATWNIAHGRGATFDNWAGDGDSKQERLKDISKLILDMDVDVVVLNEVDFCSTWSGGRDQAETIAQQTGYPYLIKQSNLDFGFIYGRWHFGNVILSRYPVSNVRAVEFAPVNQWEPWLVGCKRGVACTVELGPENLVSVMGLHLESRGEAVRVREVAGVNRVASYLEHPLILAGDLNTTPIIAPQSNLDAAGRNAFEELIRLTGLSYSPALSPAQDELTFPAFGPKTTIDWILFSGDKFSLVGQKVLKTQLSDHLPVVAEFKIE